MQKLKVDNIHSYKHLFYWFLAATHSNLDRLEFKGAKLKVVDKDGKNSNLDRLEFKGGIDSKTNTK